jgi:hypothetical protein
MILWEFLMSLYAILRADKLTSDISGHGCAVSSWNREKRRTGYFRNFSRLLYYNTVPEGGGMTTLLDSQARRDHKMRHSYRLSCLHRCYISQSKCSEPIWAYLSSGCHTQKVYKWPKSLRRYLTNFVIPSNPDVVFSVSSISLKMAVFWVVAPCSLVEVYQRFRGACCLYHQGDYTAQQPRRQQSSYSPP